MNLGHFLLPSAQIVVKTKKLCNGQELCAYNSLCDYNFFMARDKPNILDESQHRACKAMSRLADLLVL